MSEKLPSAEAREIEQLAKAKIAERAGRGGPPTPGVR